MSGPRRDGLAPDDAVSDDDAVSVPDDDDAPDDEVAPDHDDAPDADEPDDEVTPRPRKRGQSMGQSIGGVLFGFEQQVWRNIPPPHELVHHARPDDPLPAGDGGFMTLEMPDPLGPRAGSGSGRRSPADPHAAGQGEPAIRDLPARATVVVRTVEPMATVDVGALVDRALPAAGARITAAGLTVDGPPIVRYLEWGGATADLEIGFPVAGPAAAIEGLPAAMPGAGPGRSALPGGRCVVAEHVGPYQDLPATWGRLMAWVWDRGLEPAGPVWESYTDNPDLTEPALLRTEVIRPIRS